MTERRFNPDKHEKLDNPERRKLFPPQQTLGMLDIKETDDILDLGAGTGYFTLPAAKMTKGVIYALDVEPKMIDMLKDRSESEGIFNIRTVQGEIEQIPLADEVVDHVIASYVLHEVDPLGKALQEIYRTLRVNGTCFCLDWEKTETAQGPPLHHRIHSSDIEKAMHDVGLTVIEKTFPTDSHYIIIAKKE